MLFTVWSRTSTLAAGLNINMREILLFTPKWNLNFETAETLLQKLVSPCIVLILNKSQDKKPQLLVRLLKLDTSFFCFLVKIWCLTFEVCWIVFVQGAEGKHVGVTQQDWSESQTCWWISLLLVLVLWDLLTARKIQNITKHIRKHLRWVNETLWFSQ